MADVAGSVSKVAHGPFVLADLEPTVSGSAPAWAGSTKIRLAWPERNRGATRAARQKQWIQPVKKGMTPPRKFQESSVILPLTRKALLMGAVTTAEMPDRKGALFALQQEQTELRQVQCVLCEGGYVGTP